MKRQLLRGEQGSTAVEFALTVVIVLLFVFGIIEFGVLVYDKHILTNASREGARAGIVMRTTRLTDKNIEDVVSEFADNYMVSFTPSTLEFDPKISPPQPRDGVPFGTELVVTVKYSYNFLFLRSFGLGPITLKAQTRMKME
jgi:Flp pilus assembly protein TadG